MGKHHSVDETTMKTLPWNTNPSLSQHNQEHLDPPCCPQLLRGEVCPFNAGNWLIDGGAMDRTIVNGITLNYGDTASAPQATPHMSYNSKAEWQ